MSNTVSGIAAQTMDGQEKQSIQYTENVWLNVNVNSYWGNAPQNAGTARWYQTYPKAGLPILGFFYQDLGAQKPEIVAHFQSSVRSDSPAWIATNARELAK
jgi:glutathione peroxidase-family protein